MNEKLQVLPLPKVLPIWEHGSRYPDVIRVSMSDGKVKTYRIDIEQPHPSFTDAMDNLDNLDRIVVGYRPKHAKK